MTTRQNIGYLSIRVLSEKRCLRGLLQGYAETSRFSIANWVISLELVLKMNDVPALPGLMGQYCQRSRVFVVRMIKNRVSQDVAYMLCNTCSYTMSCPPVRGDNPRDLASGLSCVQVDKHGTAYISVDLVHHEIFRAKVGKGGIKCILMIFH